MIEAGLRRSHRVQAITWLLVVCDFKVVLCFFNEKTIANIMDLTL